MRLFKKEYNITNADEIHQRTLHKNLQFTALEQYKLLRANLEFTVTEDTKCPIIGVTSSVRGEGKSTTSVNLSFVLAEKGSRVLLIDGDLRLPSVAKKMGIDNAPGLTNMLIGQCEKTIEDYKSELLDTWYILPAGDIPPNPSELLGSSRMGALLETFKEQFDYIVIDLPPVNIVSDAVSVSKYISGMVVVVREEYTEKKELTHCMRQLSLSNVNVLGCVLNEARGNGGSYGKYKKYKYYRYYYKTDKDDEKEAKENKL